MTSPNIVYLHSHDTGRWIEPYGFPVPTPRLTQLACDGVRFTDAHCAGPTCSPSRAALLTGEYPHQCGMIGLAHRGFVLRDPSRHLCHTLKTAGYQTVLTGFQHVARAPFADPASLGYDRRLLERDFDGVETGAANFISEKHTTPFFLDVGFFETHRHGPPDGTFVDAKRPIGTKYLGKLPAPLPEGDATRVDFGDYQAGALELDRKIGVVLDAIDRAGIAENTLIVCTTDHGVPFPGCKSSLTPHGTGVFLILRGPGFRGGRVVTPMVSHLDLYPTLCQVAGIAAPRWLVGAPLQPLVDGSKDRLHDRLFAEVTYHAAYEPMRSVRDDRYTYIRRYHDRPGPTLPNMDDGLTKSLLAHTAWRYTPPAREELYDRTSDPSGSANVADHPAFADVKTRMSLALDEWMQRSSDPLLAGDVPPPPGAIVTDAAAYSPSGNPGVGPHPL